MRHCTLRLDLTSGSGFDPGTSQNYDLIVFYLFVSFSSSSSSSLLSSSSVTSQVLIDLFRPHLIVFSKVFQVIFVHLVYNSALFLASSFCSFLLHVVANLICILVFRQRVLLSTLPKCLHYFCGQKGCIRLFF